MSQIVLENTSKHYVSQTALENVTLSFQDNATTAIVGPSGSGKSTLLQLINGLVKPDTGRVIVFGQDIDYEDLTKLRLRIGYAVQGIGLFPHMRVWDNITLLARIAGWTDERTRGRAAELMALVGLASDLVHRFPHELSGGQQQRVGLCRAMMLNPKIFLLDEPFGALDPITRGEIHGQFIGLQQSEARTIVLVTHDMREAIKLSKHLVILDRGRVVQQGTGEEITTSPANEFVADLFRSQAE